MRDYHPDEPQMLVLDVEFHGIKSRVSHAMLDYMGTIQKLVTQRIEEQITPERLIETIDAAITSLLSRELFRLVDDTEPQVHALINEAAKASLEEFKSRYEWSLP